MLCPQVSYGATTTLPVVKQVRVGAAEVLAPEDAWGVVLFCRWRQDLSSKTGSFQQAEEGKEIVCFSR